MFNEKCLQKTVIKDQLGSLKIGIKELYFMAWLTNGMACSGLLGTLKKLHNVQGFE